MVYGNSSNFLHVRWYFSLLELFLLSLDTMEISYPALDCDTYSPDMQALEDNVDATHASIVCDLTHRMVACWR